jgi:hypothetical protein
MHIRLTHRKGFRRAGVALAVGALATIGLVPATSASAAGPAAVAPPRSSICDWQLTPSRFWVTDAAARVFNIWSPNYNSPGSRGVAYKVTGQFSHSATEVFTAYNDLLDIVSPAYVINDRDIIPDPGSVNPFVPGTRVMAPNRNFTMYFWPDSIPVPAGLKNVVLYPTKPEDPGGVARWSLALRMYHMQPGYSAPAETPLITAVSAANPSRPVRCPLTRAGTLASQVVGFYAHRAKYGPIESPPEPPTGDKVYFTRYPAAFFVGLDGYPGTLPYGCAQYLTATVPLNQISVTTMHKVPEFFNNDQVTPASIMKDYPIRYQSLTDSYFTVNGVLYRSLWTNTIDSVYTSNGEWVVVWLPSEPRLTPAQERAVRAVAAAFNYNVIQLPPKATGPIARNIPDGLITLRQKAISSSFPYSNLNTPCWSEDHDYKTYPQQTSPAFFAKYASSPANNGPYYIDGVKLSLAQFMAKFSTK